MRRPFAIVAVLVPLFALAQQGPAVREPLTDEQKAIQDLQKRVKQLEARVEELNNALQQAQTTQTNFEQQVAESTAAAEQARVDEAQAAEDQRRRAQSTRISQLQVVLRNLDAAWEQLAGGDEDIGESLGEATRGLQVAYGLARQYGSPQELQNLEVAQGQLQRVSGFVADTDFLQAQILVTTAKAFTERALASVQTTATAEE